MRKWLERANLLLESGRKKSIRSAGDAAGIAFISLRSIALTAASVMLPSLENGALGPKLS